MRILLWHGYLLRGSGSNVYTANVARSWRKQGHDVLVLCQESDPSGLDFVDAIGAFDESNHGFDAVSTGVTASTGRCEVVRPFIGGLLPVYVYDDYEGFTVKRFVDLDDDELGRYTRWNVDALTVAIQHHKPDAIVTGHEVMGPYIAAKACERTGNSFVAKLHGSALEYAVKLQDRYLRYAREGLSAAAWVAGGSEYMIAAAAKVIPGWDQRAVVVNPGCDTELFKPAPRADDAVTAGFVGKFIAAKGVHHFLAALPLLRVAVLRAVVVGYGGFEAELRALARALQEGDVEVASAIARRGDGNEPLADLASFLGSVRGDSGYWERAAGLEISFPGRLEHGPLSEVLPTFDALAVPSVVPEAFGMVAAEAAACGVLPIVPAHSGIGEVGRTLEKELDSPGLLTFDPSDPVRSMATRLDEVLSLPAGRRREMGDAIARLAHRLWSWEHVAAGLLDLATR